MSTIFCVEDDKNIRELILYTLAATGFEARGFESARGLFDEIEGCAPDLILLDIMLPETDGMDILKQIKSYDEAMPVIMVTAKSDQIDKIKGLDAGADDYIIKPFDIMELVSRVKAVLRRSERSGASDMLIHHDLALNQSARRVTVGGHEISLTFKEYELLLVLLKNRGTVMSRDRLMNEVWGTDFEGETRTVDVHIRTLRQKLGEACEYIETVRNVGYKIDRPNKS